MKKNIILLFILAAFTSAMFTSCDDTAEGTLFEVGDQVHAAFASNVQKVDMVPADNNQIKVPVYRGGNNASEATVSLEMTPAASIPAGTFTLTNPQLVFPAGQNVAYAIIGYANINNLAAGTTYELTLKLTSEDQLSPAKASQIKVQAQRKLTFAKVATASLESEWEEVTFPVEVFKAAEADVYRIMNMYANGFHITFSVAADNKITFSTQPMGYVSSSYGMTSFTFPRATDPQPYREGKVFHLYARFNVSAGSFGLFHEMVTLP
jgi:hypothetical protein